MGLVKLSKLALKDLENIFEIISKDKPSTASEYIERIRSFMKLLEINPKMSMDCKDKVQNKDCRVLFYENYTILYKIYESHISIKRVINTKQNY